MPVSVLIFEFLFTHPQIHTCDGREPVVRVVLEVVFLLGYGALLMATGPTGDYKTHWRLNGCLRLPNQAIYI